MASLTESARSTRQTAQLLRRRSAWVRSLSLAAATTSHARQASCSASCERARHIRSLRFTSGWSGLLWQRPGPELDQVLVAIEGRER